MKPLKYFSTKKSTTTFTNVLLTVYLLVLLWILIFKLGVRFSYMETRSINLIPFEQPLRSNGETDASEMILNVLIFVPLGVYAGVLIKQMRFGTKLLIILVSSSVIESIQFIFKIGAFDITDIITNTSGGAIGVIIYTLIEKLFNNSVRAQKFVNIIGAIGTVVVVSFLILLKLNMLPMRYQ